MDQVTHTVPPGFVWPTPGFPGRVPLWALVPDPNQPRKYFDPDDLKALASTLKAENGGEQREIATVSALTPEEMARYAPGRYMLVSGERRWRGLAYAGRDDIEIRVKSYETPAQRKLDVYMLNEGRVGLSDIENADAIADLMQEFGWVTQEETARNLGKDPVWVSQHLSLLKLSPKARAAMSPAIKEYARLKRGVGVFLSRLSFETQDDFVERMPKDERTTAGQQIRWMREQIQGTDEELPPPKFKPSTLRRVLGHYAAQTERRAAELFKFETLSSLFENSTLEQQNDLLGGLKDAKYQFDLLMELVLELAQAAEQKKKIVPAPAPKSLPPAAPALPATPSAAAEVVRKQQEPAVKRVEEKKPAADKPAPRPSPQRLDPHRITCRGRSSRPRSESWRLLRPWVLRLAKSGKSRFSTRAFCAW